MSCTSRPSSDSIERFIAKFYHRKTMIFKELIASKCDSTDDSALIERRSSWTMRLQMRQASMLYSVQDTKRLASAEFQG